MSGVLKGSPTYCGRKAVLLVLRSKNVYEWWRSRVSGERREGAGGGAWGAWCPVLASMTHSLSPVSSVSSV